MQALHPTLHMTPCLQCGRGHREGAEHQPGQAVMAAATELLPPGEPCSHSLWVGCPIGCTAPPAVVCRWE